MMQRVDWFFVCADSGSTFCENSVTADSVDEASLDAHLKSDVKAADALINVACPSSRTSPVPGGGGGGGGGGGEVGATAF